ncbi:hypothetical protein KA517_01750 [Candidatus Gracilibacteria bacterium]|nr:hypothetical protein [Candidatus Gracilibacteria bacterium]
MIATIKETDLDRATLMLAAMPFPQLPRALESSSWTFSTRDIVELIGHALSYKRGEQVIDATVGSAAMVLSLLAELINQRNRSQQFEQQASDTEGFNAEELGRLHVLELHTQRTLQTLLCPQTLHKLGGVSEGISIFLKQRGIEQPHAGDFIKELAHAVLLLADIERRYRCEVVRPHLLAILKGENPSSLTPPVTGII